MERERLVTSTKADKINSLLESANVSVQKFWPNLFAKTLSSRSHAEIGEIILGSGGSGGAVSAGPAETSSAGSASSAPAEEKKVDKKAAAKDDSEESEGDMVRNTLLCIVPPTETNLFSRDLVYLIKQNKNRYANSFMSYFSYSLKINKNFANTNNGSHLHTEWFDRGICHLFDRDSLFCKTIDIVLLFTYKQGFVFLQGLINADNALRGMANGAGILHWLAQLNPTEFEENGDKMLEIFLTKFRELKEKGEGDIKDIIALIWKPDYEGATSLHWAAQSNNSKVVKLLLRDEMSSLLHSQSDDMVIENHSVAVNYLDDKSETPLFYACLEGHLDV